MLFNFRSRRSQIEIVGLMIIVLMISFIFLFLIVRIINPSDKTSNTENEKLAGRFVNTVINTNSGCTSDTKIVDLLTDCSKWKGGSSFITCDDGNDSCTYVNNTLEYILEETLVNWTKPYELIITGHITGAKITHLTGGNLSQSTSGQVSDQPLPVGREGNMQVKLCLGGC